jgi:hypothetical protein
MTTWAFFAFDDPKAKSCVGFRYHNGDLTEAVQKQVVASFRLAAKKNGDELDCIVVYPLSDKPTTHGHQRWLQAGYDLYLWTKDQGMSTLGRWQ